MDALASWAASNTSSAAWVVGAVAETAQQGSAWNLYEEELLVRLAAALAKQHPSLCKSSVDEPAPEELFRPIEAVAAEKLNGVSRAAPSRHRRTLADMVVLARNVQKARAKFKALGERNLRAQIKQTRAQLHTERARAKKEAEAARAKRAEAAAAAKESAAAAAGKAKSDTTDDDGDSDDDDDDDSDDDDSKSESKSESDDGDSEDDSEDDSDDSKSDDESDDDDDDESDSNKDTASVAESKASSRGSSALSSAMTEELPRERKARRRLEKEGATVHMAEAPGTIHAAEQRARASLGVHVAPGYEHAKEAEQRAFPPGWHAALTSALGASLAERAKARQANAEGAADAGKAKPKAKAKAAKGGAKGGDEAADRNEIQQLEGKIQAIGHHFAAKHFSHFARQPALLEPPAIDRAVRARVVSKSAVEMLTALQMTDEAAAAAGKAAGDGSPAGSPVRAQSKASQRAKLTSKGSQRGDPPKSAGGAAAASAAAGGSSGSALQQLVERQIKFVGQRALWREACRRAAADDDDATASPADAPSASTLPGAESGGHGAASPPDMRLVLGLLGEGVAAGLEAVPSLKARLPALSGSELPPALREAAWRVAMGHGERDIEKCGDLLHGCPLARSAAGYPDAESDARLASAPWHLLAKGLDSLDLAPAAKKEVEGRACALLLQARECGSSDVPSPADFGALALAVALGTPSPPESLAARARRDAEARRQASLLGGKNEKLSGGHMNPIEHPLEPSPVAMLLHAARHGVVTAVAAAGAPESGVLPLVESRWPRLFTHLTNICSRADLADVIRRKQGPQPPRATLQKVLETEWLHNGFVGALPREALLWAWDQFALQGWGLAAELAAACLWLIRREVRRLDRDDNAGVTELRVAMCVALRQAAQLEQLQALLAPAAARVRERAGLSDVAPQVMLKMPVA